MHIESKTLKSSLGKDYETGTLSSLSEIAPDVTKGANNAFYTNFICQNGGSPGSAECKLADGMLLGSHVTINGSTEIQQWVYRSKNGKVFDIYLHLSTIGLYQYQVFVDGQGPDTKDWIGGLKLCFMDMTGDEYALDIISTERKVHYVRFNSARPNLKSFRWLES